MAEKSFSNDEVEAIRAQVRGVMEAEGLSQVAVARDSGVAYGTLTGWLAGTYQGRSDRVAAEVQIWLASREERQRAAAVVPRAPGFVETRSAAAFLEALRFAQVMPEISVIAGGAGIGKTTAAERYQATTSNVWLATMDPSTAGVHGMLAELAEVMGVQEKVAMRLPRAIGRRIAGSGGLIIIDEAQHLQPVALDMLRSLYDRHGVGVALVGNQEVYARLEGEGRKASFAQLYSRVGVRVTQARPRGEDVCALIAAWEVTEGEQIRLLKAIASKPGGLRSLTKCLQLASMLAAGAGESRGTGHIRAAWQRLSASAGAAEA